MKKKSVKSLQLLSIPIVILTIVALIFCKQFQGVKYFDLVRVLLIVLLMCSLIIDLIEIFKCKQNNLKASVQEKTLNE